MSIVDEFLATYRYQHDYFVALARECDEQCRMGLRQRGIRCMVTSRAKQHDSLRVKVEARNVEKNYQTVTAVFEDLRDLAGVRLALYFPGDAKHVQEFIESQFDVVDRRYFPASPTSTAQRFSGYGARHFLVRLKDVKDDRLRERPVEIQVASVLMHAWSEVEHDLRYKPLSGELSSAELAILDGINGLVLTGEVFLEQLQAAVERRVSSTQAQFADHFELAAFLNGEVQHILKTYKQAPNWLVNLYDDKVDPSSIIIGRVDVLLKFLRAVMLDTPAALRPFLRYDDQLLSINRPFRRRISPLAASGSSLGAPQPLSEQLIRTLLLHSWTWFPEYRSAIRGLYGQNPYAESGDPILEELPSQEQEDALQFFAARAIAAARAFHVTVLADEPPSVLPDGIHLTYTDCRINVLVQYFEGDDQTNEIELSESIMHSARLPPVHVLLAAGQQFEGALNTIAGLHNGKWRTLVDRAANHFGIVLQNDPSPDLNT